MSLSMRACCSLSRLSLTHYAQHTFCKPKLVASSSPRWSARAMATGSSAQTGATSSSSPALIQLFQSAKKHLNGGAAPPTLPHVKQLCKLAGAVPLTEAGFPEALLQDPAQVIPFLQEHYTRHPFLSGAVTYLHIYDDPAFSMGIFMLPAGTSIPLHNHPGMTVISQLLFGSLHVKAYDLQPSSPAKQNVRAASSAGAGGGAGAALDQLTASVKSKISWPGSSKQPAGLPATLALDTRVTAPHTMVLHPNSCNIHEFTAVTHCAILDILTPPYDEQAGRDCTYYQEVVPGAAPGDADAHGPGSVRLPVGSVVNLQAVDSDFCTSNAPYTGLRVI